MNNPWRHAEVEALSSSGIRKYTKVIVFRHRINDGNDEFSCAKPCACCTKTIRRLFKHTKATISYTDHDGQLTPPVLCSKLSDGLPSSGTIKKYSKRMK